MTVCPFAVWRPVQNHSGPMSAHLGLVLHVQQGNGGLSGWFNNPASGASSTWWVAKSGTLEQYVDSDLKAWAQSSGNATYNSVETEGFVEEPLTPAQEETLSRLYRWGSDTYGWLDALAEAPGQQGFGWHGMGGSSWGGHTGCPGDVRKPRRRPILDTAFGGGPAPSPQEDTDLPLHIVIAKPNHDGGKWWCTDWMTKWWLPSAGSAAQIIVSTRATGGKIECSPQNGPVEYDAETVEAVPEMK